MEELQDAVKNDLKNNKTDAAVQKLLKYFKDKKTIQLDIAIIGESGSGKSTFVNAFRGLGDDDEGAAATGVTESSKDISPYFHPEYPNVTLWDLPGMGTMKFPADTYLERVEFKKYDLFFIISDVQFRENYMNLAKEIKKMRKKFYFIRSKIDNDVRTEERKKNFNEQETLDRIREQCVNGLQRQGLQCSQVFLVSSFESHLYDFPQLQVVFNRDLSAHKRDALMFAMSSINWDIINKKKTDFQFQIKLYAGLSAGVAALPIPGLSVAVDLSLIVKLTKDYVAGFGIDKSSLRRLAASAGVSYSDLCDVIRSPLAKEEITQELIQRLLISLAATATLLAAEEGSRWTPIVGFGFALAMVWSFVATDRILNHFLSELAEDAHNVFKQALGLM